MPYKRIDLAPFMSRPEADRYVHTHPFTICFVYPKNGENFVVTGPHEVVDAYLKKFTATMPCFWRWTYWKDGENRGGWSATHFYIVSKAKREKKDDWGIVQRRGPVAHEISGYSEDGKVVASFMLRRMPHRWIPEFDRFLECKSVRVRHFA